MGAKTGPKTVPIDWGLVAKLSAIQCTQEEVAFALGMSVDTIQNRAPKELKKKLSEYMRYHAMGGKISLRRAQFKLAENGNGTMQIWLGKQYLYQSDEGIKDPNAAAGLHAEKQEVDQLVSWLDELEKV